MNKKHLFELKRVVNALLTTHTEVLTSLYAQNEHPSANPGPHAEASEKETLLEKLEKGTISYQEALKLREILKEERKKATGMASVAIGGLLALLDVVIETSQPPKIKAKGGN